MSGIGIAKKGLGIVLKQLKKPGHAFTRAGDKWYKKTKKLRKNRKPDLFTGEFWSGSKAKKLGLIDGLGNMNEILKEKFGEDVIIKKFEQPKSWLNKKLSGASESQIENLLNILEEKSVWQRYGF